LSLDIPVADWVRRAQEGDVRAFEQLFQQYHRGIYNTIYQMTHNDADAADLTQEVFVRAYRALPRLQTPEAFTSWLYRIAVNLSRNWLRDRGRVRIESLEVPGEEGEEGSTREIADPSGDPAALAQTRDMQERVQKAIAGLSPDHRQVVMLHHIEGMPVEEIARVMGCSIGTVKSRLSRARENLKRKLAGYVEG
jgi:RNA polymerase sigma-70 factor, ECF subfamily